MPTVCPYNIERALRFAVTYSRKGMPVPRSYLSKQQAEALAKLAKRSKEQ